MNIIIIIIPKCNIFSDIVTDVCLLCRLTMFYRNSYIIGTDTERIISLEEVSILQDCY